MKFLPLIWSSLHRKKLRTILTVLSICVAFLLFGFLCAINEAFTGGVNLAGADRLMVRHKTSIIQSLPMSYEQRIASIPGVSAVAGQSWFGAIYQDPKNVIGSFAVNPATYLDMYPEILVSDDQKQAWMKTRNGTIVGRSILDLYKWKVGQHIPVTAPIWGQPAGQSHWDLEIVGVYDATKKSADPSGLFIRHDFFEEGRERGKGQIGWFSVRIQNPDQAAEIAKKIDQEFANSPNESKTETEAAMASGFAKQIGNIGKIVTAVLCAVFFTILLVAGNTMGQSVRERTEELGVLKSLGFPNQLVLFLVLFESCVIATLGGGAGLLLGKLVIRPDPKFLPNLYLPGKYILVGLALALLLGVISGIIPAVQAMRLRIAEALRRGA